MAPADPNAVYRIKVRYTGPFGEHFMLFHKKPAADEGDFLTEVREVLTAMTGLMWDTASFLEAFFALAGSPIFNGIASWTPITASSSAVPGVTTSPAQFTQFGGRASDGRRVKLYLFETGVPNSQDMRYTGAENSVIGDVLDILNSETSTIGTITGSAPIWKNYANVGQNDYLVHKARG